MRHYKTGYCFTSLDLFEKFDTTSVKMPKKYHKNGGKDTLKESFASMLTYLFYLIVLDIIQNNITFVFPLFGGKEACLYVKVFDGEIFQRAYQKGKFEGIDFLASEFKGYQIFFQYISGAKEIREKPIYISHRLKDIFYDNINKGKKYY